MVPPFERAQISDRLRTDPESGGLDAIERLAGIGR